MPHLHRLWTRQLLREFEDICWCYRLALLPPVFEISLSEKTYGSWHSQIRTIRIGENLIVNFSWDIVLQILKHEMAHQYCSEVLQREDIGHGDEFQKACELLGVPYFFRHSRSDLAGEFDVRDHSSKETRQSRKFIARVEKLLSLAKSANKNEAAAAMRKASDLMEKYNLQEISTDEDNYGYTIIDSGRKRLEGYQRRICSILQEFFFVKVVLARLYNPENDHYQKTIELLGRRENVEIARYCYYFLEKKLQMLWEQNRKTTPAKGLRARNSYYLGLLEGFQDKLKQQEENRQKVSEDKESSALKSDSLSTAGQTTSITCLENDPGLQIFMKQRYPRLVKGRKTKSRINMDIFAQGRKKGKTIIFYKGVTEKQGDGGKLIE